MLLAPAPVATGRMTITVMDADLNELPSSRFGGLTLGEGVPFTFANALMLARETLTRSYHFGSGARLNAPRGSRVMYVDVDWAEFAPRSNQVAARTSFTFQLVDGDLRRAR